MNSKRYINEIIQRSCLSPAERKRLKKDLTNEIDLAVERGESIEQIIERMGEPDEVAAGLYENSAANFTRPFREYKSKRMLFGLPLVHIIRANYTAGVPNIRFNGARFNNFGGRYGYASSYSLPTARGVLAIGQKAKGIIAVGNFSTGIIAIGNICTGIFSIGNLCAGVFSLGNLSLALVITLGNLAIGPISAGNAAVGYAAAGNVAIGNFAVGNRAEGVFSFTITDLPAQFDEIKMFFSGIDIAPIKVFYGAVEKFLGMLINPYPALPFVGVCIIVLLTAVIIAKRSFEKFN